MHPAVARQTGDPLLVRLARADGNCNESIVTVRGPPRAFRRDSWRLPPQPSPALPSPPGRDPFPSPTPSTSTCSRRAAKAKAKARGKSPRTMARFCQVDISSRMRLVWLEGGRVWRALGAPLQAQHSSVSAAHRRPHPGLYRPNSTRTVVRNPLQKHQHPVHIYFRMHEPAPC